MDKLKIAVASKNPAKIQAVAFCLDRLEIEKEITAFETDSAVSAQPFSIMETRQGAINRASSALGQSFDLAIGLEGGVFELEETLYLCNWGALASADGKIFTAGGAQIPLPEEIARELRKGLELGPIMDDYANGTGLRHHKGAIGVLTSGLVNRKEMFGHIVKILMGQYLLNRG